MTGISAGIAMLVFTLCTTQCSKKNGSSMTTAPKMVSLKSNATLGNYLADQNGHTLYFFSNDANGQNNCPGGCAVTWPAFSVSNLTADQLDAGLNLTDFKSISITGGGTQMTYKGWPLYRFGADSSVRANTKGITVGGIGTVWPVMVSSIAPAPHP